MTQLLNASLGEFKNSCNISSYSAKNWQGTMAGEEQQLIRLKDDFYRDGFYKALSALGIVLIAVFLLISISVYLEFSKPSPVVFASGNDFRILPAVSLDQPYISEADLIQWVSDMMPAAFTYDFVNYDKQLSANQVYFTANGWKSFLSQLNVFASGSYVQNNKLFLNATPAGAPIIQNQGLLKEGELNGVYGWWIQMPINLGYSNGGKENLLPLLVQVLVVRISNLNNIAGVAIEKMVVTKGSGDQALKNG